MESIFMQKDDLFSKNYSNVYNMVSNIHNNTQKKSNLINEIENNIP